LLLIGGAIGGVIYFGLALLLGIEEIRTLPMALLRYTQKSEQGQ